MTHTPQTTPWDAAQRARDIEIADWYIWAARRRIQQASREMAIHRREITNFEDSFALQLAQLQQHARTTQPTQQQEGPDLAAIIERTQTMLLLSEMIARAVRMLGDQAQNLEQMAAAAYWTSQGYQDPPAN